MTSQEFRAEYEALAHAIQTGVAMEIERSMSNAATPKHLRVGVNMAMCETSAVARLLMEKGVITENEYFIAILRSLGEEKTRYEERINAALGGGPSITLG